MELGEQQSGDVLGEGLRQREPALSEGLFDASDDLRVVDRVRHVVGLSGAAVRQADFEVELDRLGDLALPFVDADLRLQAKFVQEYDIHGSAWVGSGTGSGVVAAPSGDGRGRRLYNRRMVIAAWVLAAYALGSISFAVVVSRAFRLPDPRSFGSGNPGATNVLRTGNKAAAACTLAGDALKGLIAVWLARVYAGVGSVDDPLIAAVALAVFLGHLYPVFFSFKGGKGVATALGILFALDWRLGASALAVWLAVFATTRISSLSALTAAVTAPLVAWSTFGRGWVTGAVIPLSMLVLWRHRANIANLLSGSEPKARGR